MAKKLDRSRDYGEIFGGGREKFTQDGRYFDVHGDEVSGEEPQAPAAGEGNAKGKDNASAAPAESEQASLLDQQLAAQSKVTE